MARKRKVSKRLQAAQDEHAKFLAKHGIDANATPKLRGVDVPKHEKPQSVTSDRVPGSAAKTAGYGHGGRVIGQPYHKGPLMVLSSPEDLKTNKRRDR